MSDDGTHPGHKPRFDMASRRRIRQKLEKLRADHERGVPWLANQILGTLPLSTVRTVVQTDTFVTYLKRFLDEEKPVLHGRRKRPRASDDFVANLARFTSSSTNDENTLPKPSNLTTLPNIVPISDDIAYAEVYSQNGVYLGLLAKIAPRITRVIYQPLFYHLEFFFDEDEPLIYAERDKMHEAHFGSTPGSKSILVLEKDHANEVINQYIIPIITAEARIITL